MGLPAPDGMIAWNGKVPPESGGVMIDPGSPLAAGPGKCRDSALGTLSPVLVGRDFHRGDDPPCPPARRPARPAPASRAATLPPERLTWPLATRPAAAAAMAARPAAAPAAAAARMRTMTALAATSHYQTANAAQAVSHDGRGPGI